jgi:hypothetical protein
MDLSFKEQIPLPLSEATPDGPYYRYWFPVELAE